MEIAILRHGMPEPISEKAISASRFSDWINSYNSAGLSESSRPSESAFDYAKGCNAIVSSNLKRAIDSARVLNTEKLVLSDEKFTEAGLPSANWRILKLTPRAWAVLFRVLWLYGYSNNSESLKEAKHRAELAVECLIYLATEHQKVLFVGHGIFNRLLVKELKKRGWFGPNTPGSAYWSFGVYAK